MATAEYCWEQGHFQRNTTAEHYVPPISANLLLSTYVYFFIRGFAFLLPHIIWSLQYKPFLGAMIRETIALLNEIERMWLRYSESANEVYQEMKGKITSSKQIRQLQKVCFEITKDVVNITVGMTDNYKVVSTFMQFRMVWDMLVLPVFVLCDIALFLTNNLYLATDFYCPLPNTETLRCVVPVLQFQWHAMLMAIICAGFVTLVTLINNIWLACVLISSNTDGCLLERLPFAKKTGKLSWSSYNKRKAYKLLSIYLMQNVGVIQSVHFLESFLKHLKSENLLIEDEVNQDMEMIPMAEGEDTGNEDVPIWTKKGRHRPKRV